MSSASHVPALSQASADLAQVAALLDTAIHKLAELQPQAEREEITALLVQVSGMITAIQGSANAGTSAAANAAASDTRRRDLNIMDHVDSRARDSMSHVSTTAGQLAAHTTDAADQVKAHVDASLARASAGMEAAVRKIVGEMMEKQGTKVRNEIAGARNEIAGARYEIAGARNEIAGARNEVAGARNEVEGARNEIEGARNEVANIRDDLQLDITAILEDQDRLMNALGQRP